MNQQSNRKRLLSQAQLLDEIVPFDIDSGLLDYPSNKSRSVPVMTIDIHPLTKSRNEKETKSLASLET